jgi:hypothetical protein
MARPDEGGAPEAGPDLSGHLLVLHSGQHLARIAARLREIESIILEAEPFPSTGLSDAQGLRRSRLQALDLVVQDLSGLSQILTSAAAGFSDVRDHVLDDIVDLPRLQSLSRALRDGVDDAIAPQTVIF